MGKSVFDLVKGKTNFLKFLFIFKIKEGIPPLAQTPKMLFKNVIYKKIRFTQNSQKNVEGQRQVKNQHYKVKLLYWGPL